MEGEVHGLAGKERESWHELHPLTDYPAGLGNGDSLKNAARQLRGDCC